MTTSPKRLITESQLRKMISKEIKRNILKNTSDVINESNSKKAIIGSVLAMLAGAGMLNKNIDFSEIKSKVEKSFQNDDQSGKSEFTPKETSWKKHINDFRDLEMFAEEVSPEIDKIQHYINSTDPDNRAWSDDDNNFLNMKEVISKMINATKATSKDLNRDLKPIPALNEDLETLNNIKRSIWFRTQSNNFFWLTKETKSEFEPNTYHKIVDLCNKLPGEKVKNADQILDKLNELQKTVEKLIDNVETTLRYAKGQQFKIK